MGLTVRCGCVAADKVTTDAVHHMWYLSTGPGLLLPELGGNRIEGLERCEVRESLLVSPSPIQWWPWGADFPFLISELPNIDRRGHRTPVTQEQNTLVQFFVVVW